MSKGFVFFFFLFFLYGEETFALWPNKYEWQKITSPHFVVLVSKNHIEYGKRVSQKAEHAFEILQQFSEKYPKKTYIIVDHTKNYTNGSATFFPYSIIQLQPNAPSTFESIGQYDDWLLELLLHEYTHILSFHNVRGLYTPLRWILGSTISPGYFMPVWYLEGLAVFNESYFTNGGRLRSSSYQALKRTLKRSNISYANEQETGTYPFGGTPYIFGGWINHHALTNSKKNTDPKEAAKSLHKKFSKRVPFFVNSGFSSSQNVSAYKSFRETFAKNSDEFRKSFFEKPLKKDPFVFYGERPLWSLEHNALFVIRKDNFLRDNIYRLDDKFKEKKLFAFRQIDFYRVTKEKIYFIAQDLEEQDHLVYNLRAYDFKSKKIKKITENFNIHNFDIYKNKIVFVRKYIDRQELVLADLSDLKKTQKTIYKTLNLEERLGLPRFITPTSVVFTAKSPKKKEQLLQLDFKTNQKEILTFEEHITYLSVAGGALYYMYEQDGVNRLSRSGARSSLTLPQGVIGIEIVNKDNIYFSRLTNEGPVVLKSSFKDLIRLKSDGEKPIKIPKVKFANKTPPKKTKVSNYSSFTKLMPNYILPTVAVSPYGFSGEFLYGASTGSRDPLELNTYSISAFTDTVSNKVSTEFIYTSNHFRMPLAFYAGKLNQPLTYDLTRTSTNASIGTSYTFNLNLGKSIRLGWGALWDKTENISTASDDLLRGGGYLTFEFKNALAQPRELAPIKGFEGLISSRYYAPVDDEYFDYLNLRMGLRTYLKSPLVSSHRFILGLDGQWNDQTLPGILTPNSLNQIYRNSALGDFVLRGAPTGSFFALDWFATGHLEYRFPIVNINWGPGLLPAFLNRITGAFTADYGVIKGADLINQAFVDSDTALYSAGAELVIEGKAFYHVPASLQVGVYQFLNKEVYDGSPELFIGFALSGF